MDAAHWDLSPLTRARIQRTLGTGMEEQGIWLGAAWILREIFGFALKRGEAKVTAQQWLVEQLREHADRMEERLRDEEEKREQLGKTMEQVSASHLALAGDYEQVQEKYESLVTECEESRLRAELAETRLAELEGQIHQVEEQVKAL